MISFNPSPISSSTMTFPSLSYKTSLSDTSISPSSKESSLILLFFLFSIIIFHFPSLRTVVLNIFLILIQLHIILNAIPLYIFQYLINILFIINVPLFNLTLMLNYMIPLYIFQPYLTHRLQLFQFGFFMHLHTLRFHTFIIIC